MINDVVTTKDLFAIATDPIYIGTGGYTIGRVDNTIVRDPTTRIPKIPGSSIAGTWRYYVALELISKIKGFQPDFNVIKESNGESLTEKIENTPWKDNFSYDNWISFSGNKIAKITCAGQDNLPDTSIEAPFNGSFSGHCGHCIVCKAFGYSKKDSSWQGMLFFSDLNIILFPVYTRCGVKWISDKETLKMVGILGSDAPNGGKKGQVYFTKETDNNANGYINLGWLNLPYKVKKFSLMLDKLKFGNFSISKDDIVIVPRDLFSKIVNSNLEVRTSVSIDPITGAAKEKALFTSEAIPRGTVFYGNIRLFNRETIERNKLPDKDSIWNALEDTKSYYEVLGIGGMTTRGFGRLKLELRDPEKSEGEKNGQ